jgi:Family of unknown function (DUF5706)
MICVEKSTDLFLEEELLNEPVTDKKVELARHLFASLESQIMLADRKVQAVFGLNAFLVAALSLQNQQSLKVIIDAGFGVNIVVDLLLKGLFLTCVCVATWSAVKALSPRLRINEKLTAPKKKSLFFFGDIKSQSLKEFSTTFISLSNEEAVKELLSSAYSVSGILAIKYKMLRRSTFSISLALLIWVLIQVNKFFGS